MNDENQKSIQVMDRFCEDVAHHMFLDFDQEEVKDISEAVKTMANRLIEIVNRKRSSNTKFETLVPCGSMDEKVRILNTMYGERHETAEIEFDFLAIMKLDGLKFVPSCQRSVHVMNERGSLEDCFASNIDLNNSIFWSVNTLCACQRSVRLYQRCEDFVFKQGPGCDKCTVMKPTGCLGIYGETKGRSFSRKHSNYHFQLELEWTSKKVSLASCKFTMDFTAERTPVRKLTVTLDIHPAFEVIEQADELTDLARFPGLRRSAISVTQNHVIRYYVIAIRCEHMHESCWRVSHCEAEMEMLKGTTLQHRQAYMTLKFIRDCLFRGNTLISSYHMKSAVLHHIEQCTNNEGNCTIHGCVQNVLEYLMTGFYSETIPDIACGFNLLFSSSTFESSKVKKNLSHVFGDMLFVVLKLFADYLANETYSFQKALKCLDCMHRLLMFMWRAAVGHRQYKACSDTEKLKTELIKIAEDYRNVDDKVRVVFDTLFEVKDLESQITEDREIDIEIYNRISLPERRTSLQDDDDDECVRYYKLDDLTVL